MTLYLAGLGVEASDILTRTWLGQRCGPGHCKRSSVWVMPTPSPPSPSLPRGRVPCWQFRGGSHAGGQPGHTHGGDSLAPASLLSFHHNPKPPSQPTTFPSRRLPLSPVSCPCIRLILDHKLGVTWCESYLIVKGHLSSSTSPSTHHTSSPSVRLVGQWLSGVRAGVPPWASVPAPDAGLEWARPMCTPQLTGCLCLCLTLPPLRSTGPPSQARGSS